MKNEILKRCRICFSKKLNSYLDLGKQPFSNSFLNYKDIKKEKKFPLKVVMCENVTRNYYSDEFCALLDLM